MSHTNYGAGRDGCEWCPEHDRPAQYLPGQPESERSDRHFQEVQAVWIVGSRQVWRLCDGCATLPRFKRFRRRINIAENNRAVAKAFAAAARMAIE